MTGEDEYSISADLLAAFQQTIIKIQVGSRQWLAYQSHRSPTSGSFPFGAAVYILTAWNPAAKRVSQQDNTQAQQALLQEIRRHKLMYYPAWGESPDGRWREESLAVLGLSRQQALALVQPFGQVAIFELTVTKLAIIHHTNDRLWARPWRSWIL